ncbi:TSC22 domain family protein 2 isoform X1 [Oryzias latipes]|uniref:TSC22 domain family protein 2 isoform X1 n=1 Tax=Oryzias latipes TaxID=8090 RepID=UPI0005CBE5FE|nr:TSC22 domain family protein 2 isoform X1 [Oryzias latipes]
MSKMPAKKKSCFQITSVTQAQVAAVGAGDDTESLDDPDETRNEDVSSELYEALRVEPADERGSPEDGVNNVGEVEAGSAVASSPGGEPRKGGVSGSSQGAQQQPPQPQTPGVSATTSQHAAVTSTAPPSTTSTVSCSSRFRVIKLDHGTGEPFRRGRWTCTEFYEKDSEGSHSGRTVDSMRHGSITLDPAADRDSGLGLTGGSVVSPATHSSLSLGSMAEVSHSSARMQPVETLPQQIVHPNYSAASLMPAVTPVQSVEGGLQNILPVGQNGLPQPVLPIQKSPIVTPSAQPLVYPPQQQQQQPLPVGHHLTGQSSGLVQNQIEYYQPLGPASGQTLQVSRLSVGQGSIPVTGSTLGQVENAVVAGAGPVSAGQTPLLGGAGGSMHVGGSIVPPGHPMSSVVQNVPVVAVSSSVPSTGPAAVLSASSAAMPNATTSSLLPAQRTVNKAPGVQASLVAGFGLTEGSAGRKSEGIIYAPSLVVSGREPMKSLMPESLQLATPTVNSLFGIPISVDGEEDRNPSTAFYQAFQPGSRLRDSKAHSDSASGTNIVAIDNKIEQAMDLVKSHLMYAVREEVEVLKEQIKELYERNSVLERENAVLKSLANSEQLSQLATQSAAGSGAAPLQQVLSHPQPLPQPPIPQQPQPQLDSGQQPQPNVTSA